MGNKKSKKVNDALTQQNLARFNALSSNGRKIFKRNLRVSDLLLLEFDKMHQTNMEVLLLPRFVVVIYGWSSTMGNEKSKAKDALTARNLAAFNVLSKHENCIDKKSLRVAWVAKIDKYLYRKIENYLYAEDELTFPIYDKFAKTFVIGVIDERVELFMAIAGETNIKYADLFEFTKSFFRTLVMVEEEKLLKTLLCSQEYEAWRKEFSRLPEYFLSLPGENIKEFDAQHIRVFLYSFGPLVTLILSHICGDPTDLTSVFPIWDRSVGNKNTLHRSSILNLEDILFINLELPRDFQERWRLLYSTKLHGESFARLSSQIRHQGPTILVIRDTDSHVFGGFAPENWSIKAEFVGDSRSFLFSLRPMFRVYPSSNYNNNYQYLNQGQHTLPNGLGMGGRFEYFGLWLDSEFGKGVCNDSCTTYRQFKRLSAKKNFTCMDVEVWGVARDPPEQEDQGGRSVLDSHLEARALLEFSGRSIQGTDALGSRRAKD